MALSLYDQMLMSDADKKKVQELTSMWEASTSQSERDSLHNMTEALRGKYGYSGSANGGGFSSTGAMAPSLGDYQSPYADRIDSALSGILDNEDFSYDPNTDESYQAFLTQVNANAKKTFDNTIAGASVGTGGRPNSWATTIASQEMGSILNEGASQMANFENIAYGRWQDGRNYSIQQLEALMGLDETAYGRFTDEYNSEVEMYNSAINSKQSDIENALSRTELTGYVSNADSTILGVPAGTPSSSARERAWAMEDYLAQAKIDRMYSSSSGGGSKSKSKDTAYYTQSEIEDLLKVKSGVSSLKPEEVGQILSDAYNGGYLSEAYYNKYMSLYKGVEPKAETKRTALTYSQIDSRLGKLTVPSSQLALIETCYKAGDISEDEANKLIDKYGLD